MLARLDPGETAGWLGEPMFFSCYPSEHVVVLVREAGFQILARAIQSQIQGGSEIP